MHTHQLYANPYINFQGKARPAMTFYQTVLGGKLSLLAMDEKGQMHEAGADEMLMHARLLSDSAIIMGTDGSPEHPPTNGDNIAVALTGSDNEKMTKIFDQLAEGGVVKMPLTDSSWGDKFGYLIDQYGINWMVDITSPDNMSLE
jgi:PhnB protein